MTSPPRGPTVTCPAWCSPPTRCTCTATTWHKIVERGGDYLLTVKDNQPTLRRDLAALFPADPAERGDFPPSPHHL